MRENRMTQQSKTALRLLKVKVTMPLGAYVILCPTKCYAPVVCCCLARATICVGFTKRKAISSQISVVTI